MSTSLSTSTKSATSFNARAQFSVGWGGAIPHPACAMFPDLNAPAESETFARGVFQLQGFLFGNNTPPDGKLGPATWAATLSKFDPVNDKSEYWVRKGRRLPVNAEFVSFVNFDQPGGLDLHRVGHFSTRRNAPPHIIVVHWGGLNPQHCYDVFCDPDRKVSSHAGIGLNAAGEPTVYQYLDLQHVAWHAGWVNSYSVGIDICQQPETKWRDHYTRAGLAVDSIQNPTGRGPSRVLSLDPRIAHATREAVVTLCKSLDIPFVFPRGPHGMSPSGAHFHGVLDRELITRGAFRGVVGHHHISPQKWDCACWWETLWGA